MLESRNIRRTYQLVETPALDCENSNFKTVYSVLEVTQKGDDIETEFIYDISRIRSSAEEIMRSIECCENEDIYDILERVL